MAHHRSLLFSMCVMFTASWAVMIAFCVPIYKNIHFYEVTEGHRSPFKIKMGALGYCSSVVTYHDVKSDKPEGTTGPCHGPPNQIAWTLESIGSYLSTNLTTHVEELRGSITPQTTHALLINFILLGTCVLGFLISLWGLFIREGLFRRFLEGVIMVISFSSLIMSAVTMAVNYVTGSKINGRISRATHKALQVKIYQTAHSSMKYLVIPLLLSLFCFMFSVALVFDKLDTLRNHIPMQIRRTGTDLPPYDPAREPPPTYDPPAPPYSSTPSVNRDHHAQASSRWPGLALRWMWGDQVRAAHQ